LYWLAKTLVLLFVRKIDKKLGFTNSTANQHYLVGPQQQTVDLALFLDITDPFYQY
jgi:hypothetical protein